MSHIPIAFSLLGVLAALYAPVLAWEAKGRRARARRTEFRPDNHT